MENKLAIFEDKKIRKVWYNDEWRFSIVDVVWALTDSVNPTDYLKKIRKRYEELKRIFENKGGGQIVPPLDWNFKQLDKNKKFSVGILSEFLDKFNQSQAKSLNHLNCG